jgi:hypothetical protein
LPQVLGDLRVSEKVHSRVHRVLLPVRKWWVTRV